MRRLLLLAGIFAGSAVLPAAAAPPQNKDETIWWRTSGAGVVEFNHNRCSLLLFNTQNTFVFTWRRSGTTLDVEDDAARFPSSPTVSAAVEIGKTWLGQPARPGELNLKATGDHMFRSIALSQPITPLLAEARSITLHLAESHASIPVDPGKMPALLRALKKCRRVIR